MDDLPTIPGSALLMFNKVDQVESEDLSTAQHIYPNALFISATQQLGLETLGQRMLHLVRQTSKARNLRVRHSAQTGLVALVTR
ncbi:hypothetical protein [Nodosilinea sp. FACHB-141]|uniref:Uncharacterized protein n=1 Tax=Leptolyngbya subtilissima DQ-A4 TaxID=2933933 RepID=A0ABV0KBS7_9CYAN|nr:hypothetical protein [Nodosilinea sp. FACHB-141]